MFKNFDKVFKFTFKNQISTVGYKSLTITLCILLFIIPIAITVISCIASEDDDEELKSCKADKIYVVNKEAPDADYNILNTLGVKKYEKIQYINSKSEEDALKTITDANETKSFILEITKDKEGMKSEIILPTISKISEEDAENFDDFITETGNVFTLISSGISLESAQALSLITDSDVYDSKGYDKDVSIFEDKETQKERDNAESLPIFNAVFMFLTIMVLYFVILMYGQSVAQNVAMEKSSKLMDTMLISLKPEAMILGKYAAIISAGLLQLVSWIISAILGVVVGLKICDAAYPNTESFVVTFLKSFSELNLFTPLSIIVGVFIILLGIMFFTSLHSIAGAISSSQEEVAGNQSVFTVLLLIGFYIAMFGGALKGDKIADWMNLVPITSPMLMPAGVCLGTVSVKITILSILILLACTIATIIISGRIYKTLALYKGKKLNLLDAINMTFKKQ